jgi:O-antigen ligase
MSLLMCVYAKPFRRLPKMLALPILGIGLVGCAARGPLLSLLAVMLVYSVMTRKSSGFRPYKQIARLSIVVVVVTAGLAWMERYPAAQEKIAEKQQELKSLVDGSRDPGGTTEQRLDFYRSAVSDFTREPLLGVGLGGWPVSYYGYEERGYPHNIVLEVAAEQGIVGLTALFAFFAAVWLAARRIWRQRPELAFAILLYVYSVLVCMFSGDINLRALWFWAGTIFAISRMCFSRESTNLGARAVFQPA